MMMRRDRIAAILAAVVIFTALFLVGSALRWTACLSALLATASMLPYVTSRRVATTISPLLIFIGVALAATALQLVPLPMGLVELLSPTKYDLIVGNTAALMTPVPAFTSLSLDPPATLVELAKLVGYFAFGCTCLRMSLSSRGRRWLVTTVALAAVALALTAIGHVAVNAKSLFGIYHPQTAHPKAMAPLLNSNHLASFLAASVPISLALAITSSEMRRLGWIAAAALGMGTTLVAASRGGAIVLVIGLLTTSILLILQRRQQHQRTRREQTPRLVLISAGIVALCGLILLVSFTAGGVATEIAETDAGAEIRAGKMAAWWQTGGLIEDNLWTGVGRGAFEPAFTRVQSGNVVTYSHVENEYLQAVIDWGVPTAIALAIALVLLGIAAARKWRAGPLEVGVISSLAVIAIHNGFEFSLELPGVALPVVALAATLVHPKLRVVETRHRLPWRYVRIFGLGGACAVALVAISPVGRLARADQLRLQSLASPSDDERASATVAAWQRHPSDYLLAGQAAGALFQLHDERAVAVANRALLLNPDHPDLHHLAARMLAATQWRDQALVEYALALTNSRRVPVILAEMLVLFEDHTQLQRGLPLVPDRVATIANKLAALGHPAIGFAYAETVLRSAPNHAGVLETTAKLALRQEELDTAIDAATRLNKLVASPASAILLALVQQGGQSHDEAVATLQAAIDSAQQQGRNRDLTDLYLAMGTTQLEAARYHAARETFRTVLGMLAGDRKRQAKIHDKLARIEDKLGNSHQAKWERKRAHELRSE